MACYLVTQKDTEIAKYVTGWNGHDVARLRGMYEEYYSKSPLDLTSPERAAKKLVELRHKILAKAVNHSSTNTAKSFQELREAMAPGVRYNRVRMIATLFSLFLDKYQTQFPTLSRVQLANGSNNAVGQMNIFEDIYNYLRSMYSAAVAKNDSARAKEFELVLNNFAPLCAHARMLLRQTEGLNLGNKIEYAAKASPDNYGENDLADLFNIEESTKEGWMESNDLISSFSTLGEAVRRVLSTIPSRTEDGAIERDDLGSPVFINPIVAHQNLIEILRGMQNESHMIRLLEKSSLPYKSDLIATLKKDPQIQTQFWCDLRKVFQMYSEINYSPTQEGIKITTYIKNRLKNMLSVPYSVRIKMGKTLGNESVFTTTGKVDWKNLQALRQYVKDNFTVDKSTNVLAKSKYETATFGDRTKMILKVSRALGIDLDEATAKQIVEDKRGRQALYRGGYATQISDLVQFGLDAALSRILTKEELSNLEAGNYSAITKNITFKKLIESGGKSGSVYERISRMLDILASKREAFRIESRVTHKDRKGKNNTLYSFVNPSYMGDFLEGIHAYAEAENFQGLQQYLEGKFLNCSIFRTNDGKILNKWIEELYNEPFNGGSLAETITFDRFLGEEDTDFENFTSKQHAISMIHRYLFAQNLKDKEGHKYANYPVFILGDSGVCKYIRAKRYSEEEIIDGMYNIYQSECQRNLLITAANKKLAEDGYSTIDNTTKDGATDTSFKMLPFLEDKKYRPEGEPSTWTEKDVKEAIRKYMDDAVIEFRRKLTALDVLEKDGNDKYKWFSDALTKEADGNMEALLRDFFFNTKFATLQQFQMMTVDVAYYKNTKDLQKRYKEIHAPGSVVSVEAWDKHNNRRYSEDGIETCVYFNDPQVNAESSNPEFMGAILYQYALPEHKDEVLKSIQSGNYGNDFDEDTLKKFLGKNYSIYESYKKNALADGQGYRTIDSYRKVMGMAGKWTTEMEDAYKKIKALRAQYGEDEEIPSEVLGEIANLAITFQPIKPYMYTLEDYPIEEGKVLKIPVQHKYAEAIIIPELLPKGSMLKHLALWMEDNNIDLAGSTTIVKVGGYGAVSISEAKDRDSLNGIMDKAYRHKLSYSDYRIQTNVPEHVNSSQLFGTQLRKLIMAGIKKTKSYAHYVGGAKVNIRGSKVNLDGNSLVNFYNDLIIANILSTYHAFEKKVANAASLSDILSQQIINSDRESLDNLLAVAMDNGEFHIPLFEGGMEHDTSAMLMSLFKKEVNKQRIKGGSCVQVSAMGITGYEESGDLKFVTSEDGKNIKYAEIEVPWDLSVMMEMPILDGEGRTVYNEDGTIKKSWQEVALKYEDYCDSNGNLIMDGDISKLEKKFPGILDRVLYRIPTERDYSMINARIKRFSQKTAGGTIKVPAQGTTIAGFDFDIDKLYFMMREFYCRPNTIADNFSKALERMATASAIELSSELASYVDIEEYDFNKDALHQNDNPDIARAVRNNMLITLIQQRLQDVDTFSERTTPGGFADHSRAARIMRELMYGNLDGIIKSGASRAKAAVEYWRGYWSRADVANQPDKVFLFGDNTDDRLRTHHVPTSTQAVIRGLSNAIGIDTKKNRGTNEGWGRTARNSYEVSSAGDRRFSALYATFAEGTILFGHNVGGRTIESVYQHGVKQGDWTTDNNNKTGAPRSKDIIKGDTEDSSFEEGYLPLWKEWAKQNPSLIAELKEKASDKVLTDKFASSRVSQARALSSIIGNSSYFTDEDFDSFKKQVDAAISKAKASGKTIVIPADGIGTGKAMLAEKAPRCFEYLQNALRNLAQEAVDSYSKGDIDFEALAERAKNKKSDPEPNYDPSDPMTIVTYNQMNQVAGKLIGIFANQNTNHAFASLMKEFGLRHPIAICGQSFKDLLHSPDGRDSSLNIAECLSASVDAVKDPVLNYLNFNTVTADAGALLARLGYTGEEIGLFLNQPIIKQVCEEVFNNNLDVDRVIETLGIKYAEMAGIDYANLMYTSDQFSMQNLAKALIDDRRQREKAKSEGDLVWSNEKIAYQLAVLKQFTDILATAQEVSSFVMSTKFTASNAVGSSFGDMYAQQLRVEKYIKGLTKEKDGKIVPNSKTRLVLEVSEGLYAPINPDMDTNGTDEDYMMSVGASGLGNPFSYEQCMYDMNRRAVKLLAKYFPYETMLYRNVRSLATRLTKSQTLNADIINELHRSVLSFVLSQREGDFDGSKIVEVDGKSMTLKDYYLKEFPMKVANLLESQPELRDRYAIFKYMILDEDKDGNIGLTLQEVGGLGQTQKDEIRDSWAELALNTKDEANPNATVNPLAKDLFMYCYYKKGFEFSPKSFMHLAPVALKERIIVDNEGTTYVDLLKKLLKGQIATSEDVLMVDFIANHTDSGRFTYKKHSGKAANDLDKLIDRKVGRTLPSEITFTVSELDTNTSLYIMGDISDPRNHVREWVPSIRIGSAVYMTVGRVDENLGVQNISYNDEMTYTLVGTINKSGEFVRLASQEKPSESVISTPEATPEGNTSVTPEAPIVTEPVVKGLSQDYIKSLAKAFVQRASDIAKEAGEMIDAQGLYTQTVEMLSSASQDDVQQFIKDAEASYGKFVDASGNPMC